MGLPTISLFLLVDSVIFHPVGLGDGGAPQGKLRERLLTIVT